MNSIEGTNAGVVAGVWRYPVKSLQGERAASIRMAPGPGGVAGDREWAIVDEPSGRALSAKTVPELLDAAAAIVDVRVHVTLPDSSTLVAGEPGCDEALSGWLGRSVRLVPASSTTASYDMTFDPPNDDAELVEIPMPEGSFVDLAPVHVLATGSLATAAGTHPNGDWDVRRFRPNVLVEAAGGDFPEDDWVGRTLAVGDAHLAVMMRTVRCALPLRAQPGGPYGRPLPRDVGVYRALAAIHDNHLGAYAEVARGGAVTIGDPVRVLAGGGGDSGR